MKTKLPVLIAFTAFAVLVIGFVLSPLPAARGLVQAAKTGDEAKLEQLVDFPAFRDSLKQQLGAELSGEVRGKSHGLGGLAAMLAPTLVDGAVDALVTPKTVATMVRTARTPDARSVLRGDGEQAVAADAASAEAKPKSSIKQSYGYRGLNVFAVTLTDTDRPDRHLALLMERRGLIGWKLAGVELKRDRGQ